LFCFSRHKGFLASLSTQDDDDEDRRRSSNIDLAASATGLGWDKDSQEDKNESRWRRGGDVLRHENNLCRIAIDVQ